MTSIKYPHKAAAELVRSVITSGRLPAKELHEYMEAALALYKLSIQNEEAIRELKEQLRISQAEVRLLKQQAE